MGVRFYLIARMLRRWQDREEKPTWPYSGGQRNHQQLIMRVRMMRSALAAIPYESNNYMYAP